MIYGIIWFIGFVVFSALISRAFVTLANWDADDAVPMAIFVSSAWPISILVALVVATVAVVSFYASTGKLPWNK